MTFFFFFPFCILEGVNIIIISGSSFLDKVLRISMSWTAVLEMFISEFYLRWWFLALMGLFSANLYILTRV